MLASPAQQAYPLAMPSSAAAIESKDQLSSASHSDNTSRLLPICAQLNTEPSPNTAAELYLDLMKKALTRALVAKPLERHRFVPTVPLRRKIVGHTQRFLRRANLEIVRLVPNGPADYLESGHMAQNRAEDAETMLGLRQLDNMQACIKDVLDNNIPGDLVEAGVWRGGMTVFMRAALSAFGDTSRQVWVLDSFEGLPQLDRSRETFEWEAGDMAVSLDEVKANFARYGLLDERVHFLKGFFNQTLPQNPIGPISILRIDADLYQSTVDVLTHLYARLSPGGYAIFDDYHNLPDCRRAIEEFRQQNAITCELKTIDKRAVYWKKSALARAAASA